MAVFTGLDREADRSAVASPLKIQRSGAGRRDDLQQAAPIADSANDSTERESDSANDSSEHKVIRSSQEDRADHHDEHNDLDSILTKCAR